ncbi:hypothetical protein FOYG_02079 [Fusarium oxysporum NRRL 32931]|uniref:Uncharacterized protein n=1 Tax=Fusarium oxysporum NRRL 32931 TaxID=660029 RepID=W9JDV8_FUSOX|nr:hypothetical protein FOYG_02079 [Fusarium oxysporum NRRL 32931]
MDLQPLSGPAWQTHFWEYSQHLNPYTHDERIRGYLLGAIYDNFSKVKMLEPAKHARLHLDWIVLCYRARRVPALQGIMSLLRMASATIHSDADYDLRSKDWECDERHGGDYDIPFRCLCSASIGNLMMAGKHINTAHIAPSNIKRVTEFNAQVSSHAKATVRSMRSDSDSWR